MVYEIDTDLMNLQSKLAYDIKLIRYYQSPRACVEYV